MKGEIRVYSKEVSEMVRAKIQAEVIYPRIYITRITGQTYGADLTVEFQTEDPDIDEEIEDV